MNGLASVVDIRDAFLNPMVILSGFIDNIEIQEAMAAGVGVCAEIHERKSDHQRHFGGSEWRHLYADTKQPGG